MARVRLVVVTVLLWSAATSAWAAKVSEWIDEIERQAARQGLLAPGSQAQLQFARAKMSLGQANVLEDELSSFVWRYASPPKMALARRTQGAFRADVSPAVRTVKQVFTLLPRDVRNAQPLYGYALELQVAETTVSMEWDYEVLRRLERKYGPGSAKLNGAEVLLSYALQRTTAFGIDRTTGYPGALEPVVAYSAAYLTYSDDKARMVSVAEFGLRRYIFANGWGGSGRLGFVKPRYVSGGFAMSGGSDAPLTSPFGGHSRYGAFFGWGEMKVAFLGGENKRLLFTQQVQIVPWAF